MGWEHQHHGMICVGCLDPRRWAVFKTRSGAWLCVDCYERIDYTGEPTTPVRDGDRPWLTTEHHKIIYEQRN